MRQSSYGICAILSFALFAACGDSESNKAEGSAASAGTSAGMSSSDGGANDSAGSPGSGGNGAGGDGDGSAGETSSAAGGGNGPTAGAGGDTAEVGEGGTGGVETPNCPDLSGDYDLLNASGDCETLNIDATELIEETAEECVMAIVSAEPDPGEKGVSGEIEVALDGSFEGARLFLDDILRFPCDGTWNEQDETLSIVCEGLGDNCEMVLARQ